MGQQITKNGQVLNSTSSALPWTGKLSPKTHFHYIHPIKFEIQDHQPIQQQNPPQIDIKTHQAEYWEIQNNQEQPTVNSIKDLQKIQEIKVKWNQFIKMKKRNYLEDYSVLKQIGRGGFGCVHKVKARYTGLYRAAKRIKKAQLKKAQHQKLFQEMAIMMSLDHPNIAKLYQVYDYKSYYVLILQLCEGGELFKKIVTKQLTEDSSAKIMKQILWTLIYLHKKGIVHRDLKPQNMLFQLDSDTLKIIDFGIAVKKKPDQVLTARLGTPYYIAPQVLCKNYGQKCDIWSAGVILFMMISGYPPFRGDNEYEVMQNVLKQTVSFKGNVWSKVSNDCKNLISWMLKKNLLQRPSAQQAFGHSWIKKVVQKTGKNQKEELVIANIRDFSFENKLQAVVYTYIVSQLLTSSQKKFLFQTFKQLDKNNDGVIQSKQLFDALKQRKDISQERVKFLMRIIDTNSSGHIDYTQFLVAGLNPKKSLTEHHFQQAFQYFDIDHSGAITFQQIAHFLQDTKQSQESIKKIFQQVDENNDGNISKEQFVKLLMQETKRKISASYSSLKTIQQDIKKQKQAKTQKSDKSDKKNEKQVTSKPQQKHTKQTKPKTQSKTQTKSDTKNEKQNKPQNKNIQNQIQKIKKEEKQNKKVLEKTKDKQNNEKEDKNKSLLTQKKNQKQSKPNQGQKTHKSDQPAIKSPVLKNKQGIKQKQTKGTKKVTIIT